MIRTCGPLVLWPRTHRCVLPTHFAHPAPRLRPRPNRSVSRNRDIYILAANYLQNLDWKADPEVVKNIVQFYSKAKALDSLSAFFDSCAQVGAPQHSRRRLAHSQPFGLPWALTLSLALTIGRDR